MTISRRTLLSSASAMLVLSSLPTAVKSRRRTLGPGYDTFLFAGQSNRMPEGMGPHGTPSTSLDGTLLQLGHHYPNNMQIISALPEIQCPQTAAYHDGLPSLMRYWAMQLMEPGRNPVAVDGGYVNTSVLQWNGVVPGPGNNNFDLYGDLKTRAQYVFGLGAGFNQYAGVGIGLIEADINIARFPNNAWHQYMSGPDDYKTQMRAFRDRLRSEIVGATVPISFLLPTDRWIIGDPIKAEFVQALRELAAEDPHSFIVETAAVPDNAYVDPNASNVHFCGQGHEVVAAREFYAMFNQPLPPDLLVNGSFDNWSNGESFLLVPNQTTIIADGWTARLPTRGSITISKTTGWGNAAAALLWQRTPGNAQQIASSIFQTIPQSEIQMCAGGRACFSYAAERGADFSGNSGLLKAVLYTSPGSGEDFNEATFSFASATAASPTSLNTLLSAQSPYFCPFDVPAGTNQAAIRLYWLPGGTAGSDDWVKITAGHLTPGAVPVV